METVTPDVALVDLVMPGMGGEELITRMRRDPRLASVPVVIVSARDWSDEAITIGLPLNVYRRERLAMGDAAQCLVSILNAVPPRYLPDAEPIGPGLEPAQPFGSTSPH